MVSYFAYAKQIYGPALCGPPEKGVNRNMAKCELCGKGPQFGHNVSHSKRRTNRRWLPNIQKAVIMVDGQAKRVNVCTRCLRTLHKA